MNEFQKILDRRGQFDTSPFFPLAHLGLARAAAIAGDTTKKPPSLSGFLCALERRRCGYSNSD